MCTGPLLSFTNITFARCSLDVALTLLLAGQHLQLVSIATFYLLLVIHLSSSLAPLCILSQARPPRWLCGLLNCRLSLLFESGCHTLVTCSAPFASVCNRHKQCHSIMSVTASLAAPSASQYPLHIPMPGHPLKALRISCLVLVIILATWSLASATLDQHWYMLGTVAC